LPQIFGSLDTRPEAVCASLLHFGRINPMQPMPATIHVNGVTVDHPHRGITSARRHLDRHESQRQRHKSFHHILQKAGRKKGAEAPFPVSVVG